MHSYCTGQPLYQIFIDVSKAYDGLDCDHTLLLLQDYRVGKNILQLLQNFWSNHTIIPQQQGIFGTPFDTKCGITQGDIVSSTIFNIVINTIHHWYKFMYSKGYYSTTIKFYANNSILANTIASNLQAGIHKIAWLFKCLAFNSTHRKHRKGSVLQCHQPVPSLTTHTTNKSSTQIDVIAMRQNRLEAQTSSQLTTIIPQLEMIRAMMEEQQNWNKSYNKYDGYDQELPFTPEQENMELEQYNYTNNMLKSQAAGDSHMEDASTLE